MGKLGMTSLSRMPADIVSETDSMEFSDCLDVGVGVVQVYAEAGPLAGDMTHSAARPET